MPVYTPPALNAVDFALAVQPSHSVAPYEIALTSYSVPALNAVNFALVSYTQPNYNTIDFEFLPSGSSAVVESLTGLLVLSGNAPTVAITDNKSVSPGTGELILSAFVPGVFGDSLRGTFGGRHPARRKRSFGWSRR